MAKENAPALLEQFEGDSPLLEAIAINAPTLFDLEAVQAVAVRYGTRLVEGQHLAGEPDYWDVPFCLGEKTGQEGDVPRVDVWWDTDGTWVIMPYMAHDRSYTSHEAEHVIEVLKQAVTLTNELNSLLRITCL